MKIKMFRVRAEYVLDLFKAQARTPVYRLVSDPLPDDARFVRFTSCHGGWLWLVVESERFDDIKEHEAIPEIEAPKFWLERYIAPVS